MVVKLLQDQVMKLSVSGAYSQKVERAEVFKARDLRSLEVEHLNYSLQAVISDELQKHKKTIS